MYNGILLYPSGSQTKALLSITFILWPLVPLDVVLLLEMPVVTVVVAVVPLLVLVLLFMLSVMLLLRVGSSNSDRGSLALSVLCWLNLKHLNRHQVQSIELRRPPSINFWRVHEMQLQRC